MEKSIQVSFYSLLVAIASFACVLVVGLVFDWDGQAAILALPFVICLYLAFPVSLIAAIFAVRVQPKLTALLVLANILSIGACWWVVTAVSKIV